MTGADTACAAKQGTLAAALLAENVPFHVTLGLLVDDRMVVITELAVSQNHRAHSRARH
jgi:hypothetical protein